MKKLLLIITLISFLSCTKDKEDPTSVNNSYIKFVNPEPKDETVITKDTVIVLQGNYNISTNELEGLGFFIDYWVGIDDFPQNILQSYRLSTRNGNFKRNFTINKPSYDLFKGKTLRFMVTISRESGKIDDQLARSVKISYPIK